ncbi:methyl-accepting chemotaxis protein [Cohnella yongneupensis]|uniref:Methyl-accepting chemotaxis protein n=1 Tax=Cohnella yongneupensis TaxID=425006 RepID=A0ABW0R3L6_9BACL
MYFFRHMKLSWKFGGTVSLVLVIVFAIMITTNLSQLRSVSLGKGEVEASNTAKAFAGQFQASMTDIQSMLATMSGTLLDASMHQSLNREAAIRMLTGQLENHDNLLGVWTIWEPNAFDNNDQANVGLTAHDDSSGRFVPYVVRSGGEITVSAIADYEKEGTGDFYLVPQRTGQTSIMEPYRYAIDGVDTLMTSLVVPIKDESGKVLGVVGADFTLDSFQSLVKTANIEGGYVTIISAKGAYIAHGSNAAFITKPYVDTPEKGQIWNALKDGDLEAYRKNSSGQSVLSSFEPIRIKGSADQWYVETVLTVDTVLSTYNSNKVSSIAVAVGSLLVVVLLLIVLVRAMIVRNIDKVIQASRKVADGDLTEMLPVNSRDEFGRLAGLFNQMIESLRTLIGHTVVSARSLAEASGDISVTTEEIARGSSAQAESAQKVTDLFYDLNRAVDTVARSAGDAAELAQKTHQGALEGGKAVNASIDSMGRLSNNMARLEDDSRQIGNIIAVIDEISEQTNLLALNAAIEAARAGEQGRGFAVVADEVRKLAERSGEATKQITTIIKGMQKSTQLSVEAVHETSELSRQTGQALEGIVRMAAQTASQVGEIAAASEEQSAQTAEVLTQIENIASVSEEAAAAAEETAGSSQSLTDLSEELSRSVSKFRV